MNKIFVGGLSWNTSSEELEDYFSQVGDVIECKIISYQSLNVPRLIVST